MNAKFPLLALGLSVMVNGCATHKALFSAETPKLMNTFEEQVANLQTPEKAAIWVKLYTRYSLAGSGWGNAEPGSTDDNCRNLAHDLFIRKAGTCGNFAAFLAYCARVHGYESGGISFYYSNGYAHIIGWARSGNRIIVQSDEKTTVYDSLEQVKAKYAGDITYYLNNRFVKEGI